MNILALDTTGLVAGVAIINEEKTLGEVTVNHKITHSQTIMPMLDSLLRISELSLDMIDYIACAAGPGSFTGLRIGAATAKGLAASLGKKIVPVATLDALAYNIAEAKNLIIPIMDARRNQVYSAIYLNGENGFERLTDYLAEDISTIISLAEEFEMPAVFLGDGVPVHKDALLSHKDFTLAPPHVNLQRAAAVGAMALTRLDEAVDGGDFAPFYLRASQAERELKEKQEANGGERNE